MFSNCEICGADDWAPVYKGAIRDGAFGSYRDGAIVAQCGCCGAQRLGERWCISDNDYETEAYRRKLKQEVDEGSYFAGHDHLQIFALQTIPLPQLRGKTIIDVGSAGGSFLDHVKGIVNRAVAVEPFQEYREALGARSYEVFPYAKQAAAELGGEFDFAFSFQVIEHTSNPRQFLAEIAPLLKPDGRLCISTPNRHDILMTLLPDEYPSFFYRVVHRWYFDADSLAECARLAGYDVVDIRHVHRYGLSNTLRWLRDRKPTGDAPMDGIDRTTDQTWKARLEAAGTSDCLFMTLAPSLTAAGGT
jgi:SAM-dependent methyltransferase